MIERPIADDLDPSGCPLDIIGRELRTRFIEAELPRLEALNEPDAAAGDVQELNGFFCRCALVARKKETFRRCLQPGSVGGATRRLHDAVVNLNCVWPRRKAALRGHSTSARFGQMLPAEISKPSGQDEEIEPSRLLLDTGNLRLLEHVPQQLLDTPIEQIGTGPIQDRLLETFRTESRFKLESLIQSIKSLGFLRNDRLIVARYDGLRFLVLEGNRRLSAVRHLLSSGVPIEARVRQSLDSLPCFVLDGAPISGDDTHLARYRDVALQYIGIRHLTGIQQWEPASRYEFLARLIDEHHMTPNDVAAHFGQSVSAILRDYRAHLLYRHFREFETEHRFKKHRLTYNTFAEATRSPDIRTWLGWSDQEQRFTNESHIRGFFDYVVKHLGVAQPGLFGEDEEDWTPEDSAEAVVRRYRDMLKRHDAEIESNLEQGDYAKAHELLELRKMGKLEQRLNGYINGLKSVSKSEMQENPAGAVKLLDSLSREALDLKSIIERLIP
ncbi:MAG: hypothetical protein ABMA01_17455 [Chthoniobacteraceae bacterium]